MEEKRVDAEHHVTWKDRKQGKITGVQDVRSFDESEILLMTSAGKIMIRGEKLHVFQLDLEKGEVEIEGRVDSFLYMSKNTEKEGKSVLKRMFR